MPIGPATNKNPAANPDKDNPNIKCFDFLNKCDFYFFLLIIWDGGSINLLLDDTSI